MKMIEKRVSDLEAQAGVGNPGFEQPWHQIVQQEGQSVLDAVQAYGTDRIGENDNLMIIEIVSPKFDADGRHMPPPKRETGLRRGNWRDLCGIAPAN